MFNNCDIIKYADDTAIVGRLSKYATDLHNYTTCVEQFTTWCSKNYLNLNVSKTKELIFDFRKCPKQNIPLSINNHNVEITSEYKYLGTIIDDKLLWSHNCTNVYSKVQQRIYFLRKLSNFGVNSTIMNLFYKSGVEGILCFCFEVYFGNSRKSIYL